VVKLIPPKAWRSLPLGLYTSLSGGFATLDLICRHDLPSADISVSIDGKPTYTDHISASPRKLLGIFGKRDVTFSKSLAVPSGEHVVQVHLSSATDGFDQTKQRELNLLSGNDTTLLIAAQRSGMSLVYQGPVIAQTKNLGSVYSDSLRPTLVTALGSAVSAARWLCRAGISAVQEGSVPLPDSLVFTEGMRVTRPAAGLRVAAAREIGAPCHW
jgi:hypothetical protein